MNPPAHLPSDTGSFLRDLPVSQLSRSLYFDKLARPEVEKSERNQFFKTGFGALHSSEKMMAWQKWLTEFCDATGGRLLFAKLRSRLLVNMSGGVMENAGVCLDRFGIPFLPGSAVKGCARRMAIQSLAEARLDGQSPKELARRLVEISHVFGWSDQDWAQDRNKLQQFKSDFVYAVGADLWPEVFAGAGLELLGFAPADSNDFGQFAGYVAFLPAYPLQFAAKDLELDVLTSHHPKYYQKSGEMPVALDNESPIPVVFPAVASDIEFQFAVLPVRPALKCSPGSSVKAGRSTRLIDLAQEWLRGGLEGFGLGAKTAAGYGWFDASEQFNRTVAQKLEQAVLHQRAEAEAARELALQQERNRKLQEEKQALASLTPEQQEDFKLSKLTTEQFRAKLDNFLANESEPERSAVVRALRLEMSAPHSRRAFWDDLKLKAQKKGAKFAKIEQAIRQLSKQLNLGKMP